MSLLICPTREDTQAAARRLAGLVRPGDIIILMGPLGCGKTTFTAALGEALTIAEPITSPSFVLMRSYCGGLLPLVHVDVYRLRTVSEFEELGCLEEGREGVVVIEWGEAVKGALPVEHLKVEFELGEGGVRTLTFSPHGDWSDRPGADLWK